MAWTVKRIYYSSGWIQGETLNTANLRMSWRTNEAGKASFFVPGTSCPLQEKDRIFITDGTKTWGGVVFNITQRKAGFQVECIDFLDALMGIEVTKTYKGKTDVDIINDILTLQKVPALTLTLNSTGVTPKTFRKLEFKEYTAYQVLDFLSKATGNKYYSYQTAYNSAPVLRYFTPPGTSSGITLNADNIYNDWSKSSPRTGIANRVKIKMNLPDVDVSGKDSYQGLVYGAVANGTDYAYRIDDSSKRYGFKFTIPRGKQTSSNVNFFLKVYTTGYAYLQIYVKKPSGTETAIYLGQPGLGAKGWYNITSLTCFDEAGTYYLDFRGAGVIDSSNYVELYFQTADYVSNNVSPGAGCNVLGYYYNYGNPIWGSGTTEVINTGFYMYMMAYLVFTNASGSIAWTPPSGQNFYGLDNNGNLMLAADGGIFKQTLSTPIRCADYPYLIVDFVNVMSYGIIRAYFYTNDSNYYYKYYSFDRNSSFRLPITITGASVVGSPDENNINKIGIQMQGWASPTIIRQLYFEGSDYEKILEDTTSQQNYEQKLYTETVPFRYKDEVDDYAQKMLDARKNPQINFSIKAKTLFNFTPYQTVSLTVGGGSYTPKVIGLDWECAAGKTNFTFENYSKSDLAAILSALSQKG